MPDQLQDGAPQPIMFSDAFYRAKRNVLWWALIAVLVAVGSAGEIRPLQVDGVVAGLAYPHRILIAGSVIILIYMAIGYVRAGLRVNSDHLAIAEMSQLRLGASAVERLSEQVGAVSDTIDQAQRSLSLIDDAVSKWDDLQTLQPRNPQGFVSQIMGVVSDTEDVPGQAPKTRFKNDPAGLLPIVHTIFTEGAQAGWEAVNNTRARIASGLETQKYALPADEKVQAIAEAVARAKRELRKLVDTISRGQRRWLTWYDHAAVAGACGIALAAGAWSWSDSSGFAAFIQEQFGSKPIAQEAQERTS